ncbi:C39 family peptidase [Candidatus Dependentiae bacterium]
MKTFSKTFALVSNESCRYIKALFFIIGFIFLPNPLLPKLPYAKTYSKFIKEEAHKKKSYVWVEKGTIPFKEIILSWNAQIPKNVNLIFSISCLVKGEWTGWKRIFVWGKNTRLTYSRLKSPRLHTKHVRAEVPGKFVATGFRIHVRSSSPNHDLKDLDALFCCISHEGRFKREKPNFDFPTTRIDGLQAQSQMLLNHDRTPDLCAPTSLSVAIQYLNGFRANGTCNKNLSLETQSLSELCHDQSLDIYGSWPLNIAAAYTRLKPGIHMKVERLNGFEEIYKQLEQKQPVVVSIRGPIKGGALPYKNGHFVVVAGWNQKHKRVLCVDPAFKPNSRTKTSYLIDDFLRAWERSRRLSYVSM